MGKTYKDNRDKYRSKFNKKPKKKHGKFSADSEKPEKYDIFTDNE